MPNAPSSISSSEHPRRGLLLAVLILAGIEVGARVLGEAPSPAPPSLSDYGRTHLPEVLLIGDSRMGRVDFGAFAAAWRPRGPVPSGMTWAMDDGSIAAQMESLAARRIPPGVLVAALSPASVLLTDHLARGRRRLQEEEGLDAGSERLRAKLAGRMFLFPRENGLAVSLRVLFQRLRAWRGLDPGASDRQARARQTAWERGYRERQLEAYRGYFSAEPKPSEEALTATVEAIRALVRRGSRVVLVRLPISADARVLEDAWGAPAAFRRVATEAGVPYVDFQDLPSGPALAEAVLDASHVNGEGPRALLASELGGQVGRLTGPAPAVP